MIEVGGKTDSEKLFEAYLNDRKLTDFKHHPDVEGTTKHPDYRVMVGDSEVFSEVAQFDTPIFMPNKIGTVDLSAIRKRIRKKIEAECQHLKALKGHMCGIVFADPYKQFRFLGPMFIIEADRKSVV